MEDFFDRTCKQWHNCQRCVQEQFGEGCTGDKTNYKMEVASGEVECNNRPNTCKRALCECDKFFAISAAEREFIWRNFLLWTRGGFGIL